LIKNPPPGAPVPPILAPRNGYLFLDRAKFRASFAADVDEEKGRVHGRLAGCLGVSRLSGERSANRRGKNKPSWYLVTTEDKMIPPAAQRAMSKRAGSTVVEEKGSHAIYVSKPRPVAALIQTAAKGVHVGAH